MNITKPLTGSLNGHYYQEMGYRAIWCDMLKMSIDNSCGRNLYMLGGYSEAFIKREIHLSRCYILSELFAQDCYYIGWNEDLVNTIRRKCQRQWHASGCIVCGKKGNDRLCWEHEQVVRCFEEGRDPEYKFTEDKEAKQYEINYQQEYIERDTVVIREIMQEEITIYA